jgi:nucleotide-binding universal stress UspA family protein
VSGPLLLCFDGSDGAAGAIRRAGALFPGREAVVLSVAVPAADLFPMDPIGDFVGRLSGIYEELDKVGDEIAGQQADEGCRIASESGLRPRPMKLEGRPVDSILQAADDCDASVIIVGARRTGPLSALVGSVAAGIVHAAQRVGCIDSIGRGFTRRRCTRG